MNRNSNFIKPLSSSLMPLAIIMMVIMASCQNDKGTEKTTGADTTDAAAKGKAAGGGAALVSSDKLYCLFLDSADLMSKLSESNGITKIIFRFSVPDAFAAAGLVELKGYPAKGHGQYAAGTTPFSVKHLTDTCSIDLSPATEYIFGNHEATRREIMKLIISQGDTISFKYLKFRPFIKTMFGGLHIVYKVSPCKADGTDIKIVKVAGGETKDLDDDGTNPTPPGNPQ